MILIRILDNKDFFVFLKKGLSLVSNLYDDKAENSLSGLSEKGPLSNLSDWRDLLYFVPHKGKAECIVYGERKALPVLGMLISLRLLLAIKSLEIAQSCSPQRNAAKLH